MSKTSTEISSEASYCLGDTDSLGGIAERFGLAGPYALYFAPGNQGLRQRCPDPTRIPVGTVLHIPSDAEQQRAGLLAHLRHMEQVREQVTRTRDRLLARFEQLVGDSSPPRERIVRMLAALLEGVLQGISVLKFSDSGMSAANHALASASLVQRPVDTPAIAIDTLSQCRLAAVGVFWVIDNPAAQAWCDAAAPTFWGKPAVSAVASSDIDRLDVGLILSCLTGQYQIASGSVARSVDMVIRDLVAELNAPCVSEQGDQSIPSSS